MRLYRKENTTRYCINYFLPSALNLTIYFPGTLQLSMRLAACVVSLTYDRKILCLIISDTGSVNAICSYSFGNALFISPNKIIAIVEV